MTGLIARPAGFYPYVNGELCWWDGRAWISPAPPEAVLSPDAPGFWLPLFHMVLRQAVLDPVCLVLVQGSSIRITTSGGRVLVEGPLDRIEVQRNRVGNLRLRNLDTGTSVRLTYGSIRRVRERLQAQVPPGWGELRVHDRAALHDPVLGLTPAMVKAEAGITARLAAALVARGARQV